jgi:ubiquinone/menaquinone biosynthesis C-methylase UbiE
MALKSYVSSGFRKIGLLHFADTMRFGIHRFLKFVPNHAFKRNYPHVVLPPDYLMYESYRLDYQKYYEDGKNTALWLVDLIKTYHSGENLSILDWGCGPGRVVRHLPDILPPSTLISATDYNSKSIQWCKENLSDIEFLTNGIHPPLTYAENSFDVVYGLSIFTHLSRNNHSLWKNELYRVLKPGGIAIISTQGKNYLDLLKGQLVCRGKVKEGHRTYSAFQPADFMRKLFSKYVIETHIEMDPLSSKVIPQDVWVFKKPIT